MDLKSVNKPGREYRNVKTTKTTKETITTSQIDSSAVVTASMFNNAQNTLIAGGSFNITTNSTEVDVMDVLHKRVAPNAILNAGGRADEVRCHPGTREEIIARIEKWRDAGADDSRTAPIFWLSGPAGAGKSAIVQTIAERCEQRRIPHANFFFFRADSSRSNASSLVATLLYQMIQLYPALRDPVATVLSGDPLIFYSLPLETQLLRLIIAPLCDIQKPSSYHPILLLIDGLDECDSGSKRSQRQILHAFDKVLAEHPRFFRLLVASRDESQIRTAFNGISSPVRPLYLNSKYSPESDIRVFVVAQFEHIRKTHPLAHTLNATWPPVEDVNGIIEKSSGQFIYAATVMRFICDSSASPVLSLERVRGAARIAAKSPFSHLDAIYTYILSQVDDQESLRDILLAQLLILEATNSKYGRGGPIGKVNLVQLLTIYNLRYTEAIVHSCLADLTPIARYTSRQRGHQLLFHHASFPDYLLDGSRSGDYYMDIDAFAFKILPAVYRHIGITSGVGRIAYCGLFRLPKLPQDFLNILSALKASHFNHIGEVKAIKGAFRLIYNLCANDDDVNKYKQIIRGWINTLRDVDIREGTDGLEYPPCSRRYFLMAHIERGTAPKPEGDAIAALRPETEFDSRETALWIRNILHRIHTQYYPGPHEVQDYRRLLKQWISWAVRNDIQLDSLDNIPGARWYLLKSKMEKWVASHLKIGKCKK